jgi:Cof subfamily protein (haloacid dehalogenase superfamily)
VRPRLLALDIDGTLLDPYGRVVDAVREAVLAAGRRGLRVVLCTGRRFRTALPVARELELTGSIVVHNGVLVKEIESGRTRLSRRIPTAVFAEVLALVRGVGSPLAYVDDYHAKTDIYTERPERAHEYQTEYLKDNVDFTRIVEDLGVHGGDRVIMVSTMGPADVLESLRGEARVRFGDRVLTHMLMNKVYRGHILEFLAPDSGKWPALRQFAEGEGIAPEEIVAIGDDDNEVEMIREAGLGIAMGNAVAAARAEADLVVRSNAEGGAAEAIERALLET